MKKKVFRRNYWAVSVEGGLYVGGTAFLSAETVLPVIVKSLGGANWIIALVPVLMTAGFMLPSILTTYWVEQRKEVKPVPLFFGILQRLPYLVAGLALLFIGESQPGLTLAIVVTSPFIAGLMGGAAMSAFYEIFSRIVPAHKRSSSLAVRYLIGGATGIAAGVIIKLILEQFPGTVGYGILHLIAFVFMAGSYAVFCLIKEVNLNHRPTTKDYTLRQYLTGLIPMISQNQLLKRFILMRGTGFGFMIIIPFLGLHAMRVTASNESFVGLLLVAHMVGGMIGNITAGLLGDHLGSKIPLVLSKCCFLVMAAGVLFNTSAWGFYAIYFLFGFAFFVDQIAATALMTSLAPKTRRPTFMAIVSFISVPSLFLASGLATGIQHWTESIIGSAWTAILLVGVSLAFLLRIPDPHTNETPRP